MIIAQSLRKNETLRILDLTHDEIKEKGAILFEMMNFALKMTGFVFKMMSFAFEMMNFVLKMMNSVRCICIGGHAEGKQRTREG